MSAAAKSRQLISAQNLVGSMRTSRRSRRSRGDGLDLDLEFGPSKTLNDHQSRGRRRIAHEFVAHLHVAAQILSRNDVGVQANEIGERHRCFGEDRGKGAKAKTRLGLHVLRNDAVDANPQLARTEDDSRGGVDFYSMGIFCKRRMDRVRVQSAHLAKPSSNPVLERLARLPRAPSMAPKLRARYGNSRRDQTMKFLGARLAFGLCLLTSSAFAAYKVSFGTNWLAEAEHGGYYQAVADGTYAKYGLDVTIVQGGPQANNELLLAAGRLDFYMGGNLLLAFDAVDRNVPIVVVAADFQKDPQVMMSHPGVGLDTWADLPKATTAFVGKEALVTFYQWMTSAFGFKEEIVRPYTFNPGPFIADAHSIQQGYVTSEPLAVEREGHFKPNIFLLADNGWGTYATTIETRTDLIKDHPDIVQRFVDASAIGWYNYLYGDNAKANALIKKDNPDMTDEQIAFSIGKIKEYGLVDSGDTQKLGVGAMTDERVKNFYDAMVKAGVEKAGLDYKKAYTLQFVNKGVGLDLRPK